MYLYVYSHPDVAHDAQERKKNKILRKRAVLFLILEADSVT